MVEFTRERTVEGVTERLFTVAAGGESVPAVIWAPEGAAGPRPLIAMGHGGSQHKKITSLADRAKAWARKFGWATLAIDAPGHGDRISREEAAANMREVGARVSGQAPATWDPERLKMMLRRTHQAVPEWKAALDVALSLPFVGGPVGYWGVSMGTAIGVPFLANEPRVSAAVLGLAGLREGQSDFEAAARAITIPVEFVFQWEDAVAARETGLALFNALGSKEKTMHINPGGHMDIPGFESASWERFFVRHLGVAADARVAMAAE
jgi:cephalosporin-C deacetylase-like acetyl esterase